jgi:peptidoglycan glycosyltransferase
MMRSVLARGTGTEAVAPGGVVGKTATVPNRPGAGARSVLWFIGFAPARDPSVAVVIDSHHGGYGGTEAAPIAAAVMRALTR